MLWRAVMAGERALARVCPGGFEHPLQSLRVVERLEKDGAGLNLTKEVRDGILNHKTSGTPHTLEGKIVQLSDKIAYINHDIDDAVRGHIITEDDIPRELTAILGHSPRERLNTLIHDIVIQSAGRGEICMSEDVSAAMRELRSYMFRSVYTNPVAKGQEKKAEAMVEQLYYYYAGHLELLPEEYCRMIKEKREPDYRVVCDYVAGMTDRYAVQRYREIMIPDAWDVY